LGTDKFQTLWFSGVLLGVSVLFIVKGGRVAWRREIENPLLSLRGGRAVAFGLGVAMVGLFGIAVALIEGMKLRS
jgi:hypothetical protein